MNTEETIKNLESLRDHCKSMVAKDEPDSIWQKDVETLDLVVDLLGHKSLTTNADRVRAMTDEELAELLCSADWCEHCDYLRGDDTCEVMDNLLGDGPLLPYCVAACLNWLQQPAEGRNDE